MVIPTQKSSANAAGDREFLTIIAGAETMRQQRSVAQGLENREDHDALALHRHALRHRRRRRCRDAGDGAGIG
jgi:hypothetical protein